MALHTHSKAAAKKIRMAKNVRVIKKGTSHNTGHNTGHEKSGTASGKKSSGRGY